MFQQQIKPKFSVSTQWKQVIYNLDFYTIELN